MCLVKNMNDIHECKLLIVDDEPELQKMVKDILQNEGYQNLTTARDCKQARQFFSQLNPDCVILDVMLTDGDGFTLMREFRAMSAAPVLFLSARDEDENRLLGLGLGADDYITKPFLPRELILRLQAILNRAYFPAVLKKAAQPVFHFADTEIDLSSGVIRKMDVEYTLTAKEFLLLEKLMENMGKIVTSDNLCHAVWGENLFRYENTLMVHIRHLREKIEPDPSHPQYLLTVRGLGYKLIGDQSQ